MPRIMALRGKKEMVGNTRPRKPPCTSFGAVEKKKKGHEADNSIMIDHRLKPEKTVRLGESWIMRRDQRAFVAARKKKRSKAKIDEKKKKVCSVPTDPIISGGRLLRVLQVSSQG